MTRFDAQLARLTPLERFELWAEMHNLALKLDLVTYYVVCCGFGFLKGLLLGSCFVRLF